MNLGKNMVKKVQMIAENNQSVVVVSDVGDFGWWQLDLGDDLVVDLTDDEEHSLDWPYEDVLVIHILATTEFMMLDEQIIVEELVVLQLPHMQLVHAHCDELQRPVPTTAVIVSRMMGVDLDIVDPVNGVTVG